MKLASGNSNQVLHSVDVIQKMKELENQHRTIYWTHIEGELYIYKPIGRKDYREVVTNEEMDNEDKKDELITRAMLYPEDFDVDDMVAGMINILFDKIMEVSYLDKEESKSEVMDYYRYEMFSLDNQVTCLINEAFPQFDIEEIENWDIERTAKYLSRAEWKLQNLRGLQFNEQYFESGQVPKEAEEPEPQEEKSNTTADSKPEKEKMTPEKLRQLQAQFPEIDWANDAVSKGGVDAMADSVDTMAPALRPGMF